MVDAQSRTAEVLMCPQGFVEFEYSISRHFRVPRPLTGCLSDYFQVSL